MSLPSIVLASSSPRRQEILGSSGLLFSTASAQGPETDDPSLGLAGLVLTNAAAKAREIAESYPQSIVIGADTLVWLNDQPLGKPADLKEARQMLERLSDCWHEVATGVHLHQLEPPRQLGFHEVTRVRFHSLDEHSLPQTGRCPRQSRGLRSAGARRNAGQVGRGQPPECDWSSLRAYPRGLAMLR